MARRRKIAAPSAEDLDRIETEYTASGRKGLAGPMAPIAEVARDAARASDPANVAERAAQARDAADAEAHRRAQDEGRVMVSLPLDAIDTRMMTRDRTYLDAGELEELRVSIYLHGMRLPIEVWDKGADATPRYGLISGYRRHFAMRELRDQFGDAYDHINALLRAPRDIGASIISMVEENEVRAQLSHFERGRIAVIAAQEGAFDSVDEAVRGLFVSGSRAKRSKIRSFALIYEELGDLLKFPEALREREGLRLSNVLRQGGEQALREALDDGPVETAEAEWARLLPVIREAEEGLTAEPSRGGRPKQGGRAGRTGWTSGTEMTLSSGFRLSYEINERDAVLRIAGRHADREMMETAIQHLSKLFDDAR